MRIARLKSAALSMLGIGILSVLSAVPASALTVNVNGVKVTYSNNGMEAYYDPSDDTLTVTITQGGGALVVTATPAAVGAWPDGYVDLYIDSFEADVSALTAKGRLDLPFYIVGQVNSAGNVTVKNGFIGGTDSYGDSGLGSTTATVPRSIKITNGVAFGPILGIDYSTPGFGKAALASRSTQLRIQNKREMNRALRSMGAP